MILIMPLYDTRFDNLKIVRFDECHKRDILTDVVSAGLDRKSYVTMDELRREFMVMNYHLRKYLDNVNAKPFGELFAWKDGRRKRGIGKVVYKAIVVEQIRKMLEDSIDIEGIKMKIAREIEVVQR